MQQDPFIAKLLKVQSEERTLGAKFGNILLIISISFFTFEIGKCAFTPIAEDHTRFPIVLALPVAIATGFALACILVGIASQLRAHTRERFAIILLLLTLIIEISKN